MARTKANPHHREQDVGSAASWLPAHTTAITTNTSPPIPRTLTASQSGSGLNIKEPLIHLDIKALIEAFAIEQGNEVNVAGSSSSRPCKRVRIEKEDDSVVGATDKEPVLVAAWKWQLPLDQATYKHLEAFEVFLVSNVDYAAELNKSKQFREVVLPVDVQAETLRRSRFTRNGGYKLFSHNGVQLCTMSSTYFDGDKRREFVRSIFYGENKSANKDSFLSLYKTRPKLRFIFKDEEKPVIMFEVDVLFGQSRGYTKHSLKTKHGDRMRLPLEEAFTTQNVKKDLNLFHKSVYTPEKHLTVPASIQPQLLECSMFGFQKRTVHWMLNREGVVMNEDGRITPLQRRPDYVPVLYKKYRSVDGKDVCFSQMLNVVNDDPSNIHDPLQYCKGGILAEEMGLGKTVELVSLIALHKRPPTATKQVYDEFLEKTVHVKDATLIITPASILEQWQDELQKHAPSLRLYIYNGAARLSGEETELIRDGFSNYDVVLTTYSVFSREVHYAIPPPDRNLRHSRKYVLKVSPLVQCQWWRICLDEAQMIENGLSSAAVVACLLPRVNAWVITGTPIRSQTNDLMGLMKFLRVEPFVIGDAYLWEKLSGEEFHSLFKEICIRHTKEQVQDELTLPPQKRIMVSLPFTQVEQSNYEFAFESMLEDCHLTPDGGPADDTFEDGSTYYSKMREWLKRLRQVCLHPQVGQRNRRALGNDKQAGQLQTVDELLSAMVHQQFTLLKNEEKKLFDVMVEEGKMLEYYRDKKRDDCLAIFSRLLREVQQSIADVQTMINDEKARTLDKKQTKSQIAAEVNTDNDDDENDEDEGGLESKSNWKKYQARLRSLHEIEHVCHFFMGHMYFQMREKAYGTDLTDINAMELNKKEQECYDRAKAIRKNLFKETYERTETVVQKLRKMSKEHAFTPIPDATLPELKGGIEVQTLWDTYEDLAIKLNEQADLLDKWRGQLVKLLTARLVDEEDDVNGDEFEESVKTQEEIFAYIDAIRALLADRKRALTGAENTLVEEDLQRVIRSGEAHASKLRELLMQRDQVKPDMNGPEDSLRGVVHRVIALRANLAMPNPDGISKARAAAENNLAQALHEAMRNMQNIQKDALDKLEKESALFRATMNRRIEFHRQLQGISTSVENYDPNATLQEGESLSPEDIRNLDEEKLKSLREQSVILSNRLAQMKSRLRYLIHMRTDPTARSTNPECLICCSPITVGILTECGHYYCNECMTEWWKRNRRCPQCRRALKVPDLHKVGFKPKADATIMEVQKGQRKGIMTLETIYKPMDNELLKEIGEIELEVSFGSKVDMITRHLLWLRRNDPGAQAVVFSQWADVLQVFQQAFKHAGIPCQIADKGGAAKFKADRNITAFLLHAKSQSSGLTLVNATHVFLCEPLVNPRLELQAISRVHRIGQTRPTTVWCYVVNGTVELSVLNVATRHRLALIGKTDEELDVSQAQVEVADSRTALETATKMENGGGELVKDEDLWECLFGAERYRLEQGLQERRDIVVNR